MLSLTVDAGSSCLREHDSPRMKKTMPAIGGIALALCFFSRATFAQTSAPTPVATPTKTLVFLGDSLTAGLGLQPSEAFPALIAEKIRASGLPFQIENAGLSGDTSAGALRRIDWLLQRQIDVLVIELGGNDGLRGLPVKSLKANVQAIIDKAKAKNPAVKIVIAGMQIPPNLGAEYAASFERAGFAYRIAINECRWRSERAARRFHNERREFTCASADKTILGVSDIRSDNAII